MENCRSFKIFSLLACKNDDCVYKVLCNFSTCLKNKLRHRNAWKQSIQKQSWNSLLDKKVNCKEVQIERRFKMINNNFGVELWLALLYAKYIF